MKTSINTLANEMSLQILNLRTGIALAGFTSYEQAAEAAKQSGGYVVSLSKRAGADRWTVEGNMDAGYDMADFWTNRGALCYESGDYQLFMNNIEGAADGLDEDDREAFISEMNAAAEIVRTLDEGQLFVMGDDREAFTTPRYTADFVDEDNSIMYRLGVVADLEK